jgi:hypothetical protein
MRLARSLASRVQVLYSQVEHLDAAGTPGRLNENHDRLRNDGY